MSEDTTATAAAGGNSNGDDGGHPFDKQVRLAALIAHREVTGLDPEPVRVNSRPLGMRFHTATNQIEYLEGPNRGLRIDANDIPSPTVDDGELVPDDGTRSIEGTREELMKRWSEFQAKYEEHTFDPKTGEKVFKVQGKEREQLAAEWRAYDQTVRDELVILEKLRIQRELLKASRAKTLQAELEREKDLDRRALELADEIEAKRRAEQILVNRKNRG